MRGRHRLRAAVTVLCVVMGAAMTASSVSADGATARAGNAVSVRAGTARLVDDLRYPSPGVVVDLQAKRVYCEGQLTLEIRTNNIWQSLQSEPTTGCFDIANRTGEIGTIYGLKVRSSRVPAAADRYRVVTTATGQPRRVSDTLVIRSVGATLSGRVTKRATGHGIDLIREFPFMNLVPWRKTPHGWRERTGVGYSKSTGSFRLPDLQPGQYKLQVQVRRQGTGLAEQWFGEADASSAARNVHLTPGAVHRQVDVSLPHGRDVWFGVVGRGPRCVGINLYPHGESLGYLDAGGPQPSYRVDEIPGLPFTSFKLKLQDCAQSSTSRHHWPATWFKRARTRRAATPFEITPGTTSSRRHPLLSARMLRR